MALEVFGGSGFIGNHWSRLTEHSHVRINLRKSPKHKPQGDVLWFISTTDNYGTPSQNVQTNLSLLTEALERWDGRGCWNFISSWFVYGDRAITPAREEDPCDPRGIYSITKRCAEQLLISFCESRGFKYRILRLANVYGPGDRPSRRKNALQWMISRLQRDLPCELYWGGDCLRNYLYVEDCARAIDLCLSKSDPASIINLGYPVSYPFGELIRYAKEYLSSNSELIAIESPAFHKQVQTRHFIMDTTELRLLGFEERTSIKEGIRECCRLTYPEP